MNRSLCILSLLICFVFGINLENDLDKIASNKIYDASDLPTLTQLKLAIEAFKNDEPFERIVTFGASCLPKIKALAYVKENQNFESWAHLFDWMFVKNFTALGKAVENDFIDVFGLNYLNVTPANWDKRIAVLHNEKYQFQFNHVFDGFNEVSHSQNRYKLTEESFPKYFPLIEKKFEHLSEKSRQGVNTTKKTLYLSYSLNHKTAEGNAQEDFIYMLKSIKSKRDDNFLYLVLVTEDAAKLNKFDFNVLIEGNLVFHLIKDFRSPFWDGPKCSALWKNIFDAILKN